jgi:hypothetical protein
MVRFWIPEDLSVRTTCSASLETLSMEGIATYHAAVDERRLYSWEKKKRRGGCNVSCCVGSYYSALLTRLCDIDRTEPLGPTAAAGTLTRLLLSR